MVQCYAGYRYDPVSEAICKILTESDNIHPPTYNLVGSLASGLNLNLANNTESHFSVEVSALLLDTLFAQRIVPIPSPSYTGPLNKGDGPAAVVGTNSPHASPGRAPEKTSKLTWPSGCVCETNIA